VPAHEKKRDLLGLKRSQAIDRRIDINRLEFPEVFHLQGMPDRKIEVRDAIISLEHRGKDPVEIGSSHGVILFVELVGRWRLQEGAELLLVDCLVVSFLGRNSFHSQVFHDRVIQRLVPHFLADLNHARDLMRLAFAHQVRDCRREHENFQRRHSPLFIERKRIVELAGKHRLPAIYVQKEFVDEGGLMSYGVEYDDLYRRAAVYVDKILKGAKPAELPVQQATKFEFIVNVKAAKQIGLVIPNRVLERANQVIK